MGIRDIHDYRGYDSQHGSDRVIDRLVSASGYRTDYALILPDLPGSARRLGRPESLSPARDLKWFA